MTYLEWLCGTLWNATMTYVQSESTLGMLVTYCGVALTRTPNLRVMGPVVSEVQKMGAHVRTCTVT